MAEWFEDYDDETLLAAARLRARRLVLAFAFVSGAVVAGAPVAAVTWPGRAALAAAVGGALLAAHAAWLAWRLVQMQRTLWRVSLSVHHVVGHDTAGRRRSVPWSRVERVNVDDAGLVVVGVATGGRRAVRLFVPRRFEGYAALGHRVVAYAESLGRPVWVDGRPWESIPLRSVYPLLRPRGAPTR